MRTYDPEPGASPGSNYVVASAETLAYAVASGQVGDPRSFKRPVRITVPRSLPTDDVLIVRKSKSKGKSEPDASRATVVKTAPPVGWKKPLLLPIASGRTVPGQPSALLLGSLEDVRWAARHAARIAPFVRAIVAPFVPSGLVALFAGLGILSLSADENAIEQLRGQPEVALPSAEQWQGAAVIAQVGDRSISLQLLPIGIEREWTATGTARPALKR